MRPVRGAVTIDLLLWIAGTLIAIVFFIGIVWPWLLSIWYGSCWADARTDLREFGSEIEGAIRGPGHKVDYKLTIGDCIAGVVFVNGNESRDKYNTLFEAECSEYSGYKSYMIAIPEEVIRTLKDPSFKEKYKEEIEKLKKNFKVWDAIKLWIKDKMGRVPPSYCYEFEHDFTPGSIKSLPDNTFLEDMTEVNFDIKNWNTGEEPYCLQAEYVGNGNGFRYLITKIQCPAAEKEE